MRVTILDPGLMDAGTHFLEWDLRLVEQLVLLGHAVSLGVRARKPGEFLKELKEKSP